jgi:carbamoylphosphate synthase small subunit
MSTQSGDDAQRPTAVAKVYLEDGTVLIGRSFGAHKSVEGEVRSIRKDSLHASHTAPSYPDSR